MLCVTAQLYDNITTTDFHIYEGNISYTKDGWFDYVSENDAACLPARPPACLADCLPDRLHN